MHLHSIEVALQGGPVPPRFISIKWGGTSAPPEFTGGLFFQMGWFNHQLVIDFWLMILAPRLPFGWYFIRQYHITSSVSDVIRVDSHGSVETTSQRAGLAILAECFAYNIYIFILIFLIIVIKLY